ncbi:DNA polymerase Y family protein [Bradyrhizobium sp. SZCCHNS3051]|uniref:Y-family DNA polymerase n=1 Tax=Bradyrhizobium sp. SZCCHNS3051 TaxID=3057320 RepID=UPI002915E510|nr:DNA polymerase Y family protein [Bradyrhizobium sp. SZCCHNS3051]
MRRVVSLFLPTWATDRLRRRNGGLPPPEVPLITAIQQGNQRLVAAVDEAARRLKLRPGMTIALAQSLVPNLTIHDAMPAEDEAALTRFALWCTRYSPLVTADPPDGVFIDIAGSAHLFKGEAALLQDLKGRMASSRIQARVAVADTPGCAWAAARFSKEEIIAPGRASDALGGLPVAALRLDPAVVESLRDVGIERIAQLATKPRGSLRTRFGADLLLRMDQALGAASEALVALVPPEVPRGKMRFAEPLSDPENLQRVIGILCQSLTEDLARRGVGARRLDLVFLRVDNIAQAVRISTSRPNRNPAHLARLLGERLVLVDPGFGIEEATLTASWIEALTEKQMVGAHVAMPGESADLSDLVDKLRIKLGAERVFRVVPVESDLPERSAKRVPAMARPSGVNWPEDLPRPSRLLTPPELVQAVAEIPDAPPRLFVWRKMRHRVMKADGPERIHGEWWLSDDEIGLQRDYYRVENMQGERFWLFRDAPADEGGRWWLHGIGEA